ncbi:6770_t:CDS:2 [Paraglomus occultum]|uniref:Biogenesis of lysosome-related organelles complex 1 subunit 5 n=1 Tax=Paraglomus occultum TaxID=144539 RepID=A0A9N8VE89_9GLOM|nr:6770_t:CDS:2 [Paraglomus occultum]
MTKNDAKGVVQGAKQFYESIFDCHRENIESEIRKFVKEFEVNEKEGVVWVGTQRNGRDWDNLNRCATLIQDAPDSFSAGISAANRNMYGMLEKLHVARPIFESLLTEVTYLKQLTNTAEPLEEDRSNVLREINAARLRLDAEDLIKNGVTKTEDAADEEIDEA